MSSCRACSQADSFFTNAVSDRAFSKKNIKRHTGIGFFPSLASPVCLTVVPALGHKLRRQTLTLRISSTPSLSCFPKDYHVSVVCSGDPLEHNRCGPCMRSAFFLCMHLTSLCREYISSLSGQRHTGFSLSPSSPFSFLPCPHFSTFLTRAQSTPSPLCFLSSGAHCSLPFSPTDSPRGIR